MTHFEYHLITVLVILNTLVWFGAGLYIGRAQGREESK